MFNSHTNYENAKTGVFSSKQRAYGGESFKFKSCTCIIFSILCRTKSSKKLKNPRNCFSWKNPRESFSSVLDYSSQQKDRHYYYYSRLQHTQRILHFRFSSVQDPVRAVYSWFETRDYSIHSGYFTSSSAVFKIQYKQSMTGLRLGTTAHTASTSLPVQQCSRSGTSSLRRVWDSRVQHTQQILHFRFSSV